MPGKINVAYLVHNRYRFSKLTLPLLRRSKHIDDIHVSVCTAQINKKHGQRVFEEAKALGINASFVLVPDKCNYLNKVKRASKMGYEYCVKLDEDVFFGPHVWDCMLDNLGRLHDGALTISPALSSGIPTCDSFVEHNLEAKQKDNLFKLFSGVKIPVKLWKGNWVAANKVLSNGYDTQKFYDVIRKIAHYYSGVHPIRVDYRSQKYLNECILDNIDGFWAPRKFEVKTIDAPYFCNSAFAIRSEVWNAVLTKKPLFVDNFDEVPLNRYAANSKGKMLFITNAFGVHTMYNTLRMFNDKQHMIAEEYEFFDKLYDRLSGGL